MVSGFFFYNDSYVSDLQKKKSDLYLSFLKGYIESDDINNLKDRFILKKSKDKKDLLIKNKSVSLEDISSDTLFNFKKFQNHLNYNESSGISQSIYYNSEDNFIFLSRDLFGITPLFYIHVPHKFIAFSTELISLLQMPQVRPYCNIDNTRISHYLKWMNDGAPYNQNTFYTNIKSVLPGHVLQVTSQTVSSTPYINFNPGQWGHLTTLEDYGSIFRSIFKNSVNRLVENKNIIGAHLSGGLDSSSVSCMSRVCAPNKVIHTFYADTNTESTNEGHLAYEAAASISSKHHIVIPTTYDLETIIKHTSLCGFPEQMVIGSALQTGLMIEAKRYACDVLMTGSDGDSIVGHGFEYLQQLTDNNDWITLFYGLQNMARNRKPANAGNDWSILASKEKEQFVYLDYFYKLLVQSLREKNFSKSLSLLSASSTYFNVSPVSLLRKAIYSFKNNIAYSKKLPTSISKKAIQNLNFQDPLLECPRSLMGNLSSHYLISFEDVFYNQAIAINEERYYLGNHYNISLAYPFYNKDLFELNFATPLKIKFDQGRGRGQFRNAMTGILPENTRLRTDKGTFGIYARQVSIRLYSQGRDFLNDSSYVWEYVDKSLFQQAVKLLLSENQPEYVHNRMLFFVNRTMNLAIWLFLLKQNAFTSKQNV